MVPGQELNSPDVGDLSGSTSATNSSLDASAKPLNLR